MDLVFVSKDFYKKIQFLYISKKDLVNHITNVECLMFKQSGIDSNLCVLGSHGG